MKFVRVLGFVLFVLVERNVICICVLVFIMCVEDVFGFLVFVVYEVGVLFFFWVECILFEIGVFIYGI